MTWHTISCGVITPHRRLVSGARRESRPINSSATRGASSRFILKLYLDRAGQLIIAIRCALPTAGIDRERQPRMDKDEDIVPTPPSTLDLDRSASAVRTGRARLADAFRDHTETDPTIAGGDVDADWESAATVGDEAP